MCDCGKNCNIPNGPQGDQGPKGDQGDTGATGANGAQGPAGDLVPFVWIDIPLANGYSAEERTPQYSIRNGFLYFRGVVKKPTVSVAPFTEEDFGFTENAQTTVGDKRSLLGTSIDIEVITFIPGNGVFPLTNVIHTLLLDSMAPISIK